MPGNPEEPNRVYPNARRWIKQLQEGSSRQRSRDREKMKRAERVSAEQTPEPGGEQRVGDNVAALVRVPRDSAPFSLANTFPYTCSYSSRFTRTCCGDSGAIISATVAPGCPGCGGFCWWRC